ncbi:hypothetical protein ASG25_00570 [Rhizobium sp. Leaf384]|uniref:TonB system transport protein ExbD n=1 Tax=unclassified Rhizobium TaxID=2613769 RepID=UPI000714E75B|nr:MULTISPECIES: TonB system transport protein ExbD [unclassified Rhizobium]KQS74436.1 hypothetical protein ASG58_15765 [Rhizobium sp. Leaf383]KQS80173.1 hypothetical protein ASG25_00570 [Rhizobium sp. Leaf384]
MATRLGDSGGGDLEENAEINVTPFIDVMLVLLIIFMVAAPLATVDMKVDLPQSAAKPSPRSDDKPVFITLKSDLTLALGNETTDKARFAADLDGMTAGNKQTRILLRADKTVDYGALMDLMNRIQQAGYSKIALVGLEGAVPAP